MSSLLDPLEDDPKSQLSAAPSAVRLILYRRPYAGSIDDQIRPLFDLESLPYEVGRDQVVAKPDLEFEEHSWLIRPKKGESFNMDTLMSDLSRIFEALKQYLPQVELLSDDDLDRRRNSTNNL